jgi:ABC-type uncharacterized transport system involved in gliding motility auxiliary subunit
MNRKLLTVGGLVLALVLLLAVNILAGATLRSAQVDLTENKLYTLSEGTRKVLGEIPEPITLHFYYSKGLAQNYPPLPDYAQRIQELLREYAARSGGKIRLEIHDPEPFTEIEDRAVGFGLQGVPVGGQQLYFGLAGTNSVGDEQVIPFFQPDKEPFLEYDLTKLVYGLAHPQKLVVGVLSALPIEGAMPNPFMQQREMPQPWFVMDQIRQLYETRTILTSAKEIPSEVGVLLIVHPKDLPPATLYAIDQFVLRGGKVLAFVDPYCEMDVPPQDPRNPMAAMMAPRSSTLGPLFDAWGVQFATDKFAGDRRNALSVTYPSRGRDERVDYVAWLGLREASFADGEIVTGQLSLLRMATAGVLAKKEGATTELTPLIHTSPESMQIGVSQIQFQPDPRALLAEFFPTNQELTLAARVTGNVQSAFPDGPPSEQPEDGEEPAEEEPKPEHLAASQGPIHVIVVADCDMLADRFWVDVIPFAGMRLGQKQADNGDLVTNALDFLHGSTDLVTLRSRAGSSRPFSVVEEIRREAEQAFRAEEQQLMEKLERAEQELNALQQKKDAESAMLLSPEQQAKIEALREEQIRTRKNLREVRHNLQKDIEGLGTRLKWLNIAAVPLLVSLLALGTAAWRVQRRKPA